MNHLKNQIKGDTWRITVLTDRLLRLEFQEKGEFCDDRTQTVVNRQFPPVPFSFCNKEGMIRIETDQLILRYDGKPFSGIGLSVELKENGFIWHYGELYGDDGNLMGTARTLDQTNGFVELEKGIFSRTGCVAYDDSHSVRITDEGVPVSRNSGTDLYFFGYGKDYYGGLRDFYALTGNTPMIPRYALGNWWSRYHKYSESSYLEMLEDFKKEQIPLSVAVIDMDWHITEVDPKYGNGWTGFTWNSELFPDYRRFLHALHSRQLAVTLNLHPADGIRAFEEMYTNVAERVGIDPRTEEAVEFDLTDDQFRAAYFEEVLRPYEADGVDFWWIDWQQGKKAGKSDIDPLWLLNHYHYKDQEEQGKRAMIFSRYAGAGSHRYPIGFSGDTLTTWESLAFQPYFTSTASNIGYGWWSHDIGGHMKGDKDLERLVRWVQFGVFSPIMRLHSSSNPFFVKEPWKLGSPYRDIVRDFMRLRHRMIPYLYTMCYESWSKGTPLIRPMYYEHPDDPAAYESENEYYFGSELIVGAITEKMDEKLRMSKVNCLIPEGRWYDLFTGHIYEGRMRRMLYRGMDTIPVLLKAGGIVPLTGKEQVLYNGTGLPDVIDLYVGYGADGSFTLFEDDGLSNDYMTGGGSLTKIEAHFDETSGETSITISSAENGTGIVPERRLWKVHLIGALSDCVNPVKEADLLSAEGGTIVFTDLQPAENDEEKELFDLIEHAWISMNLKEELYNDFTNPGISRETFVQKLKEKSMPLELKDAIRELLNLC